MDVKHSRYLAVETSGSTIVNAVLNLLGAWIEFHGRARIATSGSRGLVADTIGQTLIVAFLSVLVPSILTRRRQGATSQITAKRPNLYLRSLLAAVVFTLIGTAFNALLLPRLFPAGVSHHDVLLYKTVYGALVGMLATWFALRTILNETG